ILWNTALPQTSAVSGTGTSSAVPGSATTRSRLSRLFTGDKLWRNAAVEGLRINAVSWISRVTSNMKRDASGTGSIPSDAANAATPLGTGTSSDTAPAAERCGGNAATIVTHAAASRRFTRRNYRHGIRELHR